MKDLEQQMYELELMMAMEKRKKYWPTYSDTPGRTNPLAQSTWSQTMPYPGNERHENMIQWLNKRGLSHPGRMELEQLLLDRFNTNSQVNNLTRRTPYNVGQDQEWNTHIPLDGVERFRFPGSDALNDINQIILELQLKSMPRIRM